MCVAFSTMKRALASLTLGAVLALSAPAARADALIGPRLSLDLEDDTEVVIGAEGRFGLTALGRSVGLQLRPSFDYYLIDNFTLIQLAMDFIFAFEVSRSVEPYVGLGLSVFFYDPEGAGDGGSEAGLNLFGGVKFLPYGRVQPFVELRPTIGDIDPILLSFGVLFLL